MASAMARLLLLTLFVLALPATPKDIALKARDTISGVLMEPGDVLRFTLHNGQTRVMQLEATEARILLTNVKQIKQEQPDGGTVYEMAVRVRIDGHPLRIVRYMSVQQTYAEPIVVNGMRIWLDATSDMMNFLTDNHGGCELPTDRKLARLGVNDATDRAAANVDLHPWLPLRKLHLDIGESYNGDDPHLGAYRGAACHAGMDLNHPKGDPLFAPIDIDDHFLFNSLVKGDNNNRWRGFHTWPNGDRWTLQSHHLVALNIPEHQPIRAGASYAITAGVLPGNNQHTHFIFRTQTPEQPNVMLDPWILFWQTFEQERDRLNEIHAAMAPLSPARTGEAVRFSSEPGTRTGRWSQRFDYYWTFGDGGFSRQPNPTHIYAKPGIYAVTLTIDDGVDRASSTQAITVDSAAAAKPTLALTAVDEFSFLKRKPDARDTYGVRPNFTPHTIRLDTTWRRNVTHTREVRIENTGSAGALAAAKYAVQFEGAEGWLTIAHQGRGNEQKLTLTMNQNGLPPAHYRAVVSVDTPGAWNSPQEFEVVLDVRQDSTQPVVVVDNSNAESFFATPYFWLEHKFRFWKDKGYNGTYLINGAQAETGAVARFQPRLRAGRYEVSFVDETPFTIDPKSRFAVRVKHKAGLVRQWIEPRTSRLIGQFDFEEGTDGFVEVLAEGSTGQVLVDAVRFRLLPQQQ